MRTVWFPNPEHCIPIGRVCEDADHRVENGNTNFHQVQGQPKGTNQIGTIVWQQAQRVEKHNFGGHDKQWVGCLIINGKKLINNF